MATRTSEPDLRNSATAALEAAVREIGATVGDAGEMRTQVRLPNGRTVALSVSTSAVIDADKAQTIATTASPGTIIVADLIGADARAVLDKAGISWLDRRGHLRVSTPDVWIDRDIEPIPRVRGNAADRLEISGAAAMAVAAGELIDPTEYGNVRPLARLTGLSPAAISQARRPLKDRGLLNGSENARTELFWALVAAWRPEWQDLGSVPRPSEDLVAAGTLAAAALGAPIITTDRYPIEIYAADVSVFERARLRAGDHAGTAVARIGVAPTRLVTLVSTHTSSRVSGHAIAHPLFVALDLATDPSRGAEALADWEPKEWDRAW